LLTSWLLDRLLKSPIGSFSKESPLFCPCNFSIVKQEKKYKKEVIEKKKQVCEVSPSLYSEEVTDYKVVQPAIYRNPEINCQNVCKKNIEDSETSFNIVRIIAMM
jgi:hypothetical protein